MAHENVVNRLLAGMPRECNIHANPLLQPINILPGSQLAAVTDGRISYRFHMFCFHASILERVR